MGVLILEIKKSHDGNQLESAMTSRYALIGRNAHRIMLAFWGYHPSPSFWDSQRLSSLRRACQPLLAWYHVSAAQESLRCGGHYRRECRSRGQPLRKMRASSDEMYEDSYMQGLLGPISSLATDFDAFDQSLLPYRTLASASQSRLSAELAPGRRGVLYDDLPPQHKICTTTDATELLRDAGLTLAVTLSLELSFGKALKVRREGKSSTLTIKPVLFSKVKMLLSQAYRLSRYRSENIRLTKTTWRPSRKLRWPG